MRIAPRDAIMAISGDVNPAIGMMLRFGTRTCTSILGPGSPGAGDRIDVGGSDCMLRNATYGGLRSGPIGNG